MADVKYPDFEKPDFGIECRFTGENPEHAAFMTQLLIELFDVANAARSVSVRAGKRADQSGVVELPESSLTRLDTALAALRQLHDLVPAEMRIALANRIPPPKAKIIPYRARRTEQGKE
ncbi:hypothetical protein PQQ73_14960 [Paraburkholderia strydomiana]|jgi:hypothetical protein|uniref:Uncharacterized protein n=1 Tax=Paraburkholderia strydomiana TaxID=1245417 RepID=A0ABW9EDF4_9BURK